MKVTKILLILFLISLIASIGAYFFTYIYRGNTPSTGCLPTNFRKEKEGENRFLLWSTTDECIGYVKYGVKDSSFPYLAVDEQGGVKLREHRVKMGGIDDNVEYFVVIVSGDKTYGKSGLPVLIKFN